MVCILLNMMYLTCAADVFNIEKLAEQKKLYSEVNSSVSV